jgi:hypothetical protein
MIQPPFPASAVRSPSLLPHPRRAGAHVSGALALAALHTALGRTTDGRLTWLLLTYSYLPRLLFPMRFALAPMMALFFIVGVVAQARAAPCQASPLRGKRRPPKPRSHPARPHASRQAQPLLGSAAIARFVQPYWLFVATFLLLSTTPDLLGRCDLYPPTTLWERCRWDGVEFSLLLLLLSRALVTTDPLALLPPLSAWALVAFSTHVMLARLLPTPSRAAALEFGLAPLFVLVYKRAGWATPHEAAYNHNNNTYDTYTDPGHDTCKDHDRDPQSRSAAALQLSPTEAAEQQRALLLPPPVHHRHGHACEHSCEHGDDRGHAPPSEGDKHGDKGPRLEAALEAAEAYGTFQPGGLS